jgi:superfamily II DNA or RNA helicase
MVNYPNDIISLINLLGENMETTWKIFKKKFIRYEKKTTRKFPLFTKQTVLVPQIKNKHILFENFRNKISCIDADTKFFPKKKVIVKKVVMNEKQLTVYEAMENEHLTEKAKEILNSGKENKQILNSFLNQTRSISNTIKNTNIISTKIKEIMETIKKENRFPIVIYSFFLKAGILAMKKHMTEYSCEIIDGQTPTEEVKRIVHDYNQQKFQVLLISGAAGYGLDLKKTAAIHIMEPAWNKAKVDQVIGRGIRYKSHYDLPKKEQYINVYHYLSVKPQGFFSKKQLSADEYLYKLSTSKDKLLQLFTTFLCTASIEKSDKKKKKTL